MLYWFLKYVLVGPWLRILFRPWVEGMEHVPAKGSAIFASNHLSFSDSFFLPLVVRRDTDNRGLADSVITNILRLGGSKRYSWCGRTLRRRDGGSEIRPLLAEELVAAERGVEAAVEE